MNILGVLKRYRNNRHLSVYKKNGWIHLDPQTHYSDNFRVEIRHPEIGKEYLSIAGSSMVPLPGTACSMIIILTQFIGQSEKMILNKN